tara:strand:+ start:7828 stop:8043 length:216 start_codon:yes stop_codon:yes gene_type:complete
MSELCSEMLKIKAGVLIDKSSRGIDSGVAPSPFYIDEMSTVASGLIELGFHVEAGRVDRALFDWCELLLDA